MNPITREECREMLTTYDTIKRAERAASARATSEPAGPTKVVAAVATGSLSASEAVALADEWVARSIKCNQRCIEACREGAEDFVTANSVRSATYLLCADELRQRMGLPIPRQPTENVPGQGRAQNGESSP